MKEKRHFIVLGLGSFGTALATRLTENGCRVTGVDTSEIAVQAVQEQLYEAVVGDVTKREALQELHVADAAAVFISLGERIEPSILSALHARELGARQIIVKGITADHGKVLRKLGVDRIVFPEVEIATQLADKVTWPNVLEIVQLDPQYSIVEMTVPNALVGKTLQEADLRRRYGVLVLAIRDVLHGKLEPIPQADYRLLDDQMLVVIGSRTDLERFRDLR